MSSPPPLQTSPPTLAAPPAACDVLVVGAGPAGSACAQMLARAGFDVVLADQQRFPRDKICGDGLIPDAHAAFRRLGVYDEVMAAAQPVRHVGCVAPRGGRVDVPGTLAVLPRKVLDLILCRAAVDAGARLLTPARFEAPLIEDERIVGASLKIDGALHTLRAGWVVLATGAGIQAIEAAGVCERRAPSGIALRGYVKNEAMVGRIEALEIVWHKRLQGGYGWIFPCPGGVFNIGVGLVDSHESDGSDTRLRRLNLRDMFAAFCDIHAPARELMAGGQLQGDLKGAPLRCSLEGATYSRPGLLVTGDAAGSTYSFTGEGIGKAMETGMHAAEALVQGREQGLADADVRQRYSARLLALKPRFELYRRADKVGERLWLIDLLVWRAKKSPGVLRRMASVLDETGNPGSLVSLRAIWKLLTV